MNHINSNCHPHYYHHLLRDVSETLLSGLTDTIDREARDSAPVRKVIAWRTCRNFVLVYLTSTTCIVNLNLNCERFMASFPPRCSARELFQLEQETLPILVTSVRSQQVANYTRACMNQTFDILLNTQCFSKIFILLLLCWFGPKKQ